MDSFWQNCYFMLLQGINLDTQITPTQTIFCLQSDETNIKATQKYE